MTALFAVRDPSVDWRDGAEVRPLLQGVSLELGRGEILGLVGDSGSGRSLLCRIAGGLMPSSKLEVTGGAVLLEGRDITRLPEAEMLGVCGRRIGVIFQNPTSHLDPVMRIGDRIREGLRRHRGLGAAAARARRSCCSTRSAFPDPARGFAIPAHEFSDGMRQRAMIAIALACGPDVLIANKPTTGLDGTIQAQILCLLTGSCAPAAACPSSLSATT